jgi:thiol-disulfide isomerase/thioredoxin
VSFGADIAHLRFAALKMREPFQTVVDAIAKWGPWLLVLLMTMSLAGLWHLWRRNRSLTRKAFVLMLLKSSWFSWLIVSGIGLWLLKIQLAPLTGSLTTLQGLKGERIPELSFRRVSDDAVHHLHEFKGKVVLLNLWATYCPPCIQELPTLGRLQGAYRDRGLVVVTLSDEPRERLQSFLKKHPNEVLSGYTSSFVWLEIENFRPMTLIIDRDGILRKHFIGMSSYEGFEAHIKPYL